LILLMMMTNKAFSCLFCRLFWAWLLASRTTQGVYVPEQVKDLVHIDKPRPPPQQDRQRGRALSGKGGKKGTMDENGVISIKYYTDATGASGGLFLHFTGSGFYNTTGDRILITAYLYDTPELTEPIGFANEEYIALPPFATQGLLTAAISFPATGSVGLSGSYFSLGLAYGTGAYSCCNDYFLYTPALTGEAYYLLELVGCDCDNSDY